MGKEKIKSRHLKVEIDTNVFVSAVLFKGKPGRLVPLWQRGEITFLLSTEILKEYIGVLSYPKFKLTEKEIKHIIEKELVPFIQPAKLKTKVDIIRQDPSDNKFLSLAVDGKADCLISGDKHLLELKEFRKTKIIPIRDFLRLIEG